MAQRFILASALSSKKTTLLNTGHSDDVLQMLETAKKLGCTVNPVAGGVEIIPGQSIRQSHFNVGESGLGVRLLIPVLAALGGDFYVEGTGSLTGRPLTEIIHFLNACGVAVTANNDFLPVSLSGKLTGGNYRIDGQASSQHISGLLMALPLCEHDSELEVFQLSSKPYVDLTLDVLKQTGIHIENIGYTRFKIPGNQKYEPVSGIFKIEGDYSGVANWVVAGAVSPNPVILSGLKKDSLQGDRRILEIAEKAGAVVTWNEEELIVKKGKNSPFTFDATHCPDLFPALVVLAASAKGVSTISGVSRLIHKESNRALTLQTEFARLGLILNLEGDQMKIHGKGFLENGTIHSHGDHRIAMAGAIAATLTKGSITVQGAESVAKSYPEFWADCAIS
ncbi:MAG: 3-phosphoshikimate 1-carboxyvinyltransferase [Bacteroidetes bacterium]|nr:3-phosphoshikimate 1-carboxyvinyltransferase [Bacteroidota bacterium]